MPLDQQATAKDLSPLTMDTYHKCPLSGSKVPLFFFLLLVLPGVTTDSYAGQNIFIYLFIYLFIYIFSQCLVPREAKLFFSCPTAWPT